MNIKNNCTSKTNEYKKQLHIKTNEHKKQMNIKNK